MLKFILDNDGTKLKASFARYGIQNSIVYAVQKLVKIIDGREIYSTAYVNEGELDMSTNPPTCSRQIFESVRSTELLGRIDARAEAKASVTRAKKNSASKSTSQKKSTPAGPKKEKEKEAKNPEDKLAELRRLRLQQKG